MGLIKNIKAALFPPEDEPGRPPLWIGNLKEAKYVSLSGVEVPFLYLDLSMYVQIKSTVFSGVDGTGAYVQNNGVGITRYPTLMVLSGSDNDAQAKNAMIALTEPGDGTLYNPVVGPAVVGITGEIEQVNAFVTEANQTSIIVEFVETTGLLIDDLPAFSSGMQDYLDSASDTFNDTLSTIDKAEEVSAAQKVLGEISKIKKKLDLISGAVAKTQAEIDDTFDSINGAIDTLIKDPLMLARQVQNLIMTPAYEIGLIKDKLAAYKNMAADIFSIGDSPTPNTYDNTQRNDFAVDALIVSSAMAALTQTSYVASTSKTDGQEDAPQFKKEFVRAQQDLIDTRDSFIEWSDNTASALDITNNSGSSGEMNDIVSQVCAEITNKISVAKTEIKFTTSYARPAMSWCFELYGSVKPEMLIFFQQTNELGGDEIFIIPAGTEIVYYV